MPQKTPKTADSTAPLKGGVAHDASGGTTVAFEAGALTWPEVLSSLASEVDRHFLQPNKFADNPGPVISSVEVYLVFWGTSWLATPRPVPYSADIILAVSSLLNSPYLAKVDQYDGRLHYGDSSHRGKLASPTFVTSPVGPTGSYQSPADPPTSFTDNNVASLITNLIAVNTLPKPDDNPNALYVVIMPTGVSNPTSGFAGEHFTRAIAGNTNQAHIAWVTNNGSLSSVTTIFSHELVESVTDPEGSAVTGVPGTCSQGGWCEIGDVCSTTGVLNGVVVQSYWSDEDQACVVPTAFAHNDFVLTKYKVQEAITLWLLVHGGDPGPGDRLIRELATLQLIESLALTLTEVNVRETIRSGIQFAKQQRSNAVVAEKLRSSSGMDSAV
jgi:hypothetical protein